MIDAFLTIVKTRTNTVILRVHARRQTHSLVPVPVLGSRNTKIGRWTVPIVVKLTENPSKKQKILCHRNTKNY